MSSATIYNEVLYDSINNIAERLEVLLESDNRDIVSILMEDGDEPEPDDNTDDSTGDDGGFDSDDDSDDEEGASLDTSGKIAVRVIKEGIDMLQEVSNFLELYNGDEYNKISDMISKTKYLFKQFISHIDDYSDDEVNKILMLFKKAIKAISIQLKK
jgi:hypothetical protein